MLENKETCFIDVNEIQSKYLPIGKKQIRKFVNANLNVKRVGNKMLVSRQELLAVLNDPNRKEIR